MKKVTRHGRQKKPAKLTKLVKSGATDLQKTFLTINQKIISALSAMRNADLLVKLSERFFKREKNKKT